MKILSYSQIKDSDQAILHQKNIEYIDLMEQAATLCSDWIRMKYDKTYRIHVFCGKGNNGGDGFAISRLLLNSGYQVETYLIPSKADLSENAQTNFDRLQNSIIFIDQNNFNFSDEKCVIVDAIFGIGFRGSLSKPLQNIIEKLNQSKADKISIDIPTGLSADELPTEKSTVFFADYTLSFNFYKRTFLHHETSKFIGKVILLELGINQDFLNKVDSNNYYLEDSILIEELKRRSQFGNKSTFGKVKLIGGSYGMLGSLQLAAKAAFKSGCGMVYVLAPKCGFIPFQTNLPEIIFTENGEDYLQEINVNSESYTIGIGPGMGTHMETAKAFHKFLDQANAPIVIDADALNILSTTKSLLEKLPHQSIITPHPKEFERLFGKSNSSLEQVEMAREMSVKYKIIIVLKGHHTIICDIDGSCHYNLNGNSGMAKAGSGDVLTGIITSLLAQGYPPAMAAKLGVFIHGKAGDISADLESEESMTPKSLIKNLSKVFLQVKNEHKA